MCQITIDIPDEVLYDTKMSKTETMDFARKSVALCYYVQEGVSLGNCAQIAGMSKARFMHYLGEHNVSIFRFDDSDEFNEEIRNA